MSRKSQGTRAERELVHAFWDREWAAFRAAGSGSTKYPCPDIIAGNAARKLALEVKKTSKERQYFSSKEVKALRVFSKMFGAECWVGVRFYAEPWMFVHVDDLDETRKNYVAPKKLCKSKGVTIDQLIQF